MSFDMMKQDEKDYLMPTYARFDLAIESGYGAVAVGEDGREYIDFGAGIGVNSLGYCDSGWVDAVTKQASKLQHISNLYYSGVQINFAKQLCELTRFGKAFLCNSGAEANECAIKLARKYSFEKYGKNRSTIIALKNSFHGRTVTTLSATGQDNYHNYFFPFTEGFAFADANDIASLESKMDGTVCAVMLEVIQGEGGVVPLQKEYLKQVERLCREQDLLLIVDEVQTGIARTGKLLAFQNFDISPDVVTLAKGLGGGLPIGACLCADRIGGVMSAGQHGTTFGGNPVVCAAGSYVLSRVTAEGFMQNVAKKGEYIVKRLTGMPHVVQVRGMGLMLGIALDGCEARKVAEKCLENGLIVLTAKTLLRLLPPLTISKEELDRGLTVLENVLKEI